MKNFMGSKIVLSILLVTILLSVVVVPVFAKTTQVSTTITITTPEPIELGLPFTISGAITDQFGKPVPNKSIMISLDGEYLGQTASDEKGNYQRQFNKVLDAGSYQITATSKVTRYLRESSKSTTLNILPTQVVVQAVPPMQGVTILMDGRRFLTDQSGQAKINLDKAGKYRLQVLADLYQNPNEKIKFGRWSEEIFSPYQDINVPYRKVIQIGLDVYHKVSQSFVDLEDFPVDGRRISEFTIKSAQGDVFTFPDGKARWIPASRVARRAFGLEVTNLYYSVSNVEVDGSNVVNQSQQKFFTSSGGNWKISLILYSLHVNAVDGIFGFPVGKEVNIDFPNGLSQKFPLGPGGTVTIHSLARGNYYVNFLDTQGLSNRIPVALSRFQEVNTRIITYLDLSVLAILGIFLAVGLLIYGRPWLIGLSVKKDKTAAFTNITEKNPAIQAASVSDIISLESVAYGIVQSLDDEAFFQLTGFKREQFDNILKRLNNSSINRGRPPKLKTADQLLMTLLYMNGNFSESGLATTYRVSQAYARQTIRKTIAKLEQNQDSALPNRQRPLTQDGNLDTHGGRV